MSMIHFAEQYFLFIHAPEEQGTFQNSYFLSQLSVFFPFWLVLDSLKHPVPVKPSSLWSYSGSSRRKEAVHAVISCSVPWALCSLHTILLPSPDLSSGHTTEVGSQPAAGSNAAGFSVHHEMDLSSQTFNLPPFTCKETAKFIDLLVLKSPLNLWEVLPEEHNLPYKTMCNENNLEEIRILQDIIVFRTGIGECKQARGHSTCCLKAGKEKKIWIRKASESQAELCAHCQSSQGQVDWILLVVRWIRETLRHYLNSWCSLLD